jgi:hypothetical protein
MWGGIPVYPQVFGVNSSSVDLLPTTIRLGVCPASDICPLALYHRELHTLTRSRQVNSVTHRKDYKPFQIEWSKSAPDTQLPTYLLQIKMLKINLFYLIEFCSQLFVYDTILFIKCQLKI